MDFFLLNLEFFENYNFFIFQKKKNKIKLGKKLVELIFNSIYVFLWIIRFLKILFDDFQGHFNDVSLACLELLIIKILKYFLTSGTH